MADDLLPHNTASQAEFSDTAEIDNFNSGEGHRARLLERYANNELSALHDHEIIELILTYAIPRKDTKSIARQLLAKFKSVSGIMNAPVGELESISGIGKRSALLFALMRDVMAYCLKQKYERESVITHRRDVEEYLRFSFGQRRDEYVAALYLDSGNHILETHIFAEGTVNQCVVYPRAVIDKALRCGAASLILAHNHPGGGLNPSEADWAITERLYTIGRLMEIPLLDHILISKLKVVSLRELPRWPK